MSAPAPAVDWRFGLMSDLAKPEAQRVLPFHALFELARAQRPGISIATVRSGLDALLSAKALLRIGNGLYLNRRCAPTTIPAEAARFIRNGAVISLHSVLGEYGVINNPSAMVTAAVPVSATKRPNVGEVTTEGGFIYRLYGLPEKFFPAAMGNEVLLPTKPYPCFRPEKALLDWIYLGNSRFSRMPDPPIDIDLEQLDLRRLNGFAEQMKITGLLKKYLDKANAMNFGEEEHESRPRRPGP